MAALSLARGDLGAALPDTSSPLRLKGLYGAIRIYRDAYGIPHIKAQSTHDAFFGQGFVTAQDRLWHMDHDRRWGYGTWAEYAGQVSLDQDLMMRRFQILSSVKADYAVLNGETRLMVDAYAAGVNAFIQSKSPLPIEYTLVGSQPEPWEPWDCLGAFKARHTLMGVHAAKLWRARLVNVLGPRKAAEVLPGYRPGHLLIIPPGAKYDGPVVDAFDAMVLGTDVVAGLEHAGSNNWVLSGSRTVSGKPLVAGDPHRPLETPNVYYQNHISCPDFDAIGLSFPGFPGFPHFGHNAYVAWCVTHAQADYQDLYMERFKKGSSTQYEFEGEWKQAEVRHEVIKVRDGVPVEVDVTVTCHGPVIAGDPASGYAAALKYTGTDGPNRGFECMLPMLKVISTSEMDEAMRHWVDPCQNFVFADICGNIEYLTRGKLPVRSVGNARLPVPGWTGEHEWQGFVPFEEMPRIRNPETGYIVTANNRIVGEDYPHYVGLDFSPEFRARRITERLMELGKATAEDMAQVHADMVSIPGRVYARLLSQIEPLDEPSAVAKAKLAVWDGVMDKDAVAPALYHSFRFHLTTVILRHALSPLAEEAFMVTGRGAPFHLRLLEAHLVKLAEEDNPRLLPPGADWSSIMAEALRDGVAYLKDRLGDDMDAWTWGSVHLTRPRHSLSDLFPEFAAMLDPMPIPLGGDGDTVLAASFDMSDPFTITSTSVARYVFDLANWENSKWIVPLGASGHPGSPHYTDQALLWGSLKLIPMFYDWSQIVSTSKTMQELKPD